LVDWTTVASLATAAGTLVLAIATFASVRSANRAARAAERSLLEGLRPVLMPSRHQDIQQKINFQDRHFRLPGGAAVAQVCDDVVYLALSIRNAGNGIAVLHGWWFAPERYTAPDPRALDHAPVEEFRRQNLDIYVSPGDVGYWEGAFRDPSEDVYKGARRAVEARDPVTVDLLYSDHEGGQRTITRFILDPRQGQDGQDGGWLVLQTLHRNVDRPDPRLQRPWRG
jgi:uncharacterized protein YjeT (DUF2065 family)